LCGGRLRRSQCVWDSRRHRGGRRVSRSCVCVGGGRWDLLGVWDGFAHVLFAVRVPVVVLPAEYGGMGPLLLVGGPAVCAVRAASEILPVTKSRRSSAISAAIPSEVIGVMKMPSMASCARVPSGNVSPSWARWVFQLAQIAAASLGRRGWARHDSAANLSGVS
jgi:hypothetical protein